VRWCKGEEMQLNRYCFNSMTFNGFESPSLSVPSAAILTPDILWERANGMRRSLKRGLMRAGEVTAFINTRRADIFNVLVKVSAECAITFEFTLDGRIAYSEKKIWFDDAGTQVVQLLAIGVGVRARTDTAVDVVIELYSALSGMPQITGR